MSNWQTDPLTRDTPLDVIREAFSHDPYRSGAARVLGKSYEQVSRDERDAYKHAFHCTYAVRAPALIKGDLEFLRRLYDELTQRGIADEIEKAIRVRESEEEADRS